MRIYISGPISGKPGDNRVAFRIMQLELERAGHTAINPHNILCPVRKPRWEDYMKADLIEMLACDKLVMLTGWWWSRGARMEHSIAKKLGLIIDYQGGFWGGAE